MARRRRSRTAQVSTFASPRLVRPVVRLRPWPRLSPYGDLRRFEPLRHLLPARTFGRKASARIVAEAVRPRFGRLPRPDVFRFAVPDKVLICVRRKERREVMFAKSLTRRVGGGAKRRNEWSAISCRRT